MSKNTFLFNHTSQETALEVKDYPYGFRLRTSIFYWLETAPKKGDRFCSCTLNPKNGRMNAPKKSTYYPLGAMYRREEDGHIKWIVASNYGKPEQLDTFIETIGGLDKLNPEQLKQYKGLKGIKVVELDKDGLEKPPFAVKWESDSEVKITFDRIDGVAVQEVFEALGTLNQEKLWKVLNYKEESRYVGTITGFVRVCVRKGVQLTTVRGDVYRRYLELKEQGKEASASNVVNSEVVG